MCDNNLGIYIHIPFCIQKCRYCDFLSAPSDAVTRQRYVESLCREIAQFPDAKKYETVSVFFGGGTPSVMDPDQIGRILETVRNRFRMNTAGKAEAAGGGVEISMECNPGTVSFSSLKRLRAAGINRLSIGAQSADNGLLSHLGRIHTWEDFLEQYGAAREAGFDNINIDLISALPGQSPAAWEDTLLRASALKPEHISAYSLIIEEGTPFFSLYHEEDERRAAGEEIPADRRKLPTEDEERLMYERTVSLLGEAGLARYEISNYARPGFECRHNKGYWERRDYAGFGLGASSLLGGGTLRSRNVTDLTRYLADPFEKEETQVLSLEEQMEEAVFLALRMDKGLNIKDFNDRYASSYGRTFDELYGPLTENLAQQGLIRIKNGYLRLTERGIHVSNYVMAQYLLQ